MRFPHHHFLGSILSWGDLKSCQENMSLFQETKSPGWYQTLGLYSFPEWVSWQKWKYSKETWVSFGPQIVEAMNLKKLKFPWESHTRRRKVWKPGAGLSRNLCASERFQRSDAHQSHLLAWVGDHGLYKEASWENHWEEASGLGFSSSFQVPVSILFPDFPQC